MECGLVCGACGAEIDREIQELREMLAQGDETGAALAIGALKARGLQPPEQSSDMGSCGECQRKFKAGQQVYENPDTGKDLCHLASKLAASKLTVGVGSLAAVEASFAI